MTEGLALVFAAIVLYRRGTFSEMSAAARDDRAAACDASLGPDPARPPSQVSPETACQSRVISRMHKRGERRTASRAKGQREL